MSTISCRSRNNLRVSIQIVLFKLLKKEILENTFNFGSQNHPSPTAVVSHLMRVKQEVTELAGEGVLLHQLVLHHPRGVLPSPSPECIVANEIAQDLLVGGPLCPNQAVCRHVTDDLGKMDTR